MDPRKAHALVKSILKVHAEGVGIDARIAQALQNAEQDLQGLVTQIIEECGDESRDFDHHVDEAIENTRES